MFTGKGYYGAWITKEFWFAALNTGMVVVSVVFISLTLGTLGGYALARSGEKIRILFANASVGVPGHATHHISIRISSAVFRMEHLGLPANRNHCNGSH